MKNNQELAKQSWKKSVEGFKVIRVEVSVPTENLYAVCTPIKKQ